MWSDGETDVVEQVGAPLLTVRDLSVEFDSTDGPVAVLDRVSFEVEAGETVGLVGESGSGKSVTSLAIMRLLPDQASVTSGHVELSGRNLLTLSKKQVSEVRG